ncbi:AAA family ATPase [Pseudomonas aeruginosa]|uniref:AAA family ATPase n=1 Tax=Pseudomonas aeruginosa TaxID=287 RepID=UPI00093FBAFE|nr:AAA family ATPase [Pseudomonas aeruginosa]MBM2553458.1 AAA family ATPase [Pseudomonas aeruginosa]MDP5812899.1 AAA family ATPase [Pseudomonas aeruginosa]PUA07252.1 hypothetical protein DB383_14495 [Pseudomonas aeruginosa]RUB67695.1 ATP-binding protein [Pseudomonas aeruginosa]HBO2837543.1 AAA family ATPase [Pseudomonas aeruginosa]
MHIKRVQIEEGFLEGLDIQLTKGLNTIIGARGTGKTSALELIRYCLGAPGFTNESSKKSHDHAIAVLGEGKVTVTLADSENEVTVTRTAGSSGPSSTGQHELPIVMSQTEVESVGLHPIGRLQLIDSFIPSHTQFHHHEASIIGEIKSASYELDALVRERADIIEQLENLPKIEAALNSLLEKEKEVASFSEAAAQKKTELDINFAESAKLAVQDAYIERFNSKITETLNQLYKALSNGQSIEPWSTEQAIDPLAQTRAQYFDAYNRITSAYEEIRMLLPQINSIRSEVITKKAVYDENARNLRRDIDAIMEGAGSISREAAKLRESKAKLESISKISESLTHKISELNAKRNELLNRLDDSRNNKFLWRKKVCEDINSSLGPRIKVSIERSSQVDNYIAILTDALRGSGLKYNDVAKTIGQLVSPRELTGIVEHNDFEQLSHITELAKDRCAKVISHLRDGGIGDIATCLIEDGVDFYLLDGTEFKELSHLSTGQRCTVILPIVLEHRDRIIIVDQPEDHIDNAFIAETLIKSIRNRSNNSQIIFTTHNANIPVLGEADRVIYMASDGRRGYVKLEQSLEHKDTVSAINSVMEGGKEAFETRAKFYAKG